MLKCGQLAHGVAWRLGAGRRRKGWDRDRLPVYQLGEKVLTLRMR